MNRIRPALLSIAIGGLCFAIFPAIAEDRMAAIVNCQAVEKLTYDCTLKLTGRNSGVPIQGAAVVVGADMPSMPLAHNVKPVRADPAGAPGEYRFRIVLDMHGEWALKIRLAQPRQDLIVQKMMFAAPTN